MGNSCMLSYSISKFKPHTDTRVAYPVCVEMLDGRQLESELAALSQTELVDWVRTRCRGWSPEPLRLSIKPGQSPYKKPMKSYTVQSGLVKSMEYALHLDCAPSQLDMCSRVPLAHDSHVDRTRHL